VSPVEVRTGSFLEQSVEHADHLATTGPDWLGSLREKGAENFRGRGFPSDRDEAWRFTNLKALKKIDFLYSAETTAGPGAEPLNTGDTTIRLVFVNGILDPSRSSFPDTSEGLCVESQADAARNREESVRRLLGTAVDLDRHPFSSLNTTFLGRGAYVRVPAGRAEKTPIHLVFMSSGADAATAAFPRVLIEVEDGAEAKLVEEYSGVGGESTFTCGVTELFLGKNASLEHTRIQNEPDSGFNIGSVSARLARDSRLTSHVVSLGGRLSRLDLDVVLEGEGSEVDLNGLYFPTDHQHMDHHTLVDHAVPHTASRELYEGVLDGKATGVFNGRVIIRSDAQKVDASQTNNNLLLSDEALVNTNPELEIFADDVKAQHGATVGQIEDEHLFYLRSRGIGTEEARQLLISAFAGKMIDRISLVPLREELTRLLEKRF
jgi:Fe-S cluster assembly protein SufD